MSLPVPRLEAIRLPHGVTLACRCHDAAAAGAPTVLMLHGFPEAAFVWDDVAARLNGAARIVAPNLRGYGDSSAPAEVSAYSSKALSADLVALIEHLGAPVDLLVAHDWGGALAWLLAARRPDLMRRLLILNAPHHAVFLQALQHDPLQQAASAYMHFLCWPDAAVRLREHDDRRLWAFFSDAHGAMPAWLTPSVRAQYRQVWDAGLDGPLNYYRASPLRPPTGPDDPLHALVLPPDVAQVAVPTTVLWGEGDRALCPSLLDGLPDHVTTLSLHRHPQATHWLVHEHPDWVAAHVQRLIEPQGLPMNSAMPAEPSGA